MDAKLAGGLIVLPSLVLPEGRYIIDMKLGEFRLCPDMSRIIAFGSDEGSRLCQALGIVNCRLCDSRARVSGLVREQGLLCVRCGMPLG